jgi:hypothetical protein
MVAEPKWKGTKHVIEGGHVAVAPSPRSYLRDNGQAHSCYADAAN